MLKSFSLLRLSLASFRLRDPQTAVRGILGILLVANLIAAWFTFNPPGGSLEDLEQQIAQLRQRIVARQATADRLKVIVSKVSMAKSAGDEFMAGHFLGRRTAYSTLISELEESAKTVGIKPRDNSYTFEPIDGSDSLALIIINANYEGTYADLVQFVNKIDRSKRLLIIETLQARPQQGSPTLAVALKIYTFVREDSGDAIPSQAASLLPPNSTEPGTSKAGGRP